MKGKPSCIKFSRIFFNDNSPPPRNFLVRPSPVPPPPPLRRGGWGGGTRGLTRHLRSNITHGRSAPGVRVVGGGALAREAEPRGHAADHQDTSHGDEEGLDLRDDNLSVCLDTKPMRYARV